MSVFVGVYQVQEVRGGASESPEGERGGFEKGYPVRERGEKTVEKVCPGIENYRQMARSESEISVDIPTYLRRKVEYATGECLMALGIINGEAAVPCRTPFPARMITGSGFARE